VLSLFRQAAADDRDAARALVRWEEWVEADQPSRNDGERRFRRRAYQRTRDQALIGLAFRKPRRRVRHRGRRLARGGPSGSRRRAAPNGPG
jgi:hypothetical protein